MGQRQGYAETAPGPGFALHRYCAAQSFGHGLYDAEPQPGPLDALHSRRPVKTLENFPPVGCRDTDSRVADGEDHLLSFP